MDNRGAWAIGGGRVGSGRIGGYVADELIGYGASAQVWRGHVARTSELVALKVLDLADASAVRAAQAEAAILSALDHPNLVRLRELMPDGESIVLVLELAGGGSLAELVQRRGRLSPGEVVAAVAPVAAALAYIHDEGVVHADVSPANILFRSDGTPILADLGVARLVGGFDAPRSTLAYVDPGVAAGGVPSEASDVFMAAATALFALTGTPPWRGESVEQVQAQAALGEIEGLEARLSGLPAPMAEVIRRALSASPVARLSAAEFALDLRHCVSPIPVDLGAGRARPPAPRAHMSARNDRDSSNEHDPADGVGAGNPATTGGRPAASPRGRLPALDPRRVLGARDRARLGTRIRSRLASAGRPAADPPVLGSRSGDAAHIPRHAAHPDPTGPHSTPHSAGLDSVRLDAVRLGPARSGPARTDAPSAMPWSSPPASPADVVALDRPDFARPEPSVVADGRDGEPAPERKPARQADIASQRDTLLPASSDRALDPPGVSERLALTHVVRARVRATVPEPSSRRWPSSPSSARLIAVLTMVVLLGSAGVAWFRWGPAWASGIHRAAAGRADGRRSATSAPRASAAPSASRASATTSSTSAGPTIGASAPPSATASTSAPPPSPTAKPSATAKPGPSSTAASSAVPESGTGRWVAVLEDLDRRRQRAFATRDPTPLASVYVTGPLLTEDAQTLRRVVSPGCRLLGLRTEYRAVHASAAAGGRVVLAARASLASAELECPGSAPRRTAANGPVPMNLVLVRRGSRYLISAISLPT